MKYTKLLHDLYLIEPVVHRDDRGYFMESYNKKTWKDIGIEADWVQDNEAKSTYGVLRGLHYQVGNAAQAKLVRVVLGRVYDVAVDIRPQSPTYKQYVGVELSAKNKKQLYIPRGYAHGYLVLSETAVFSYKCDNFYNPDAEAGLSYKDPGIGIEWPLSEPELLLSPKDKKWPQIEDIIPINI